MKKRIERKATIVGILLLMVAVSACCATGKIVRDGKTYTAEVMSSLLREKAAAKHLRAAAEAAKAAGDVEACKGYAAPALLIEAKAQGQAYRALWLAGLNYPHVDGTIPKSGAEQDDPGPSGSPADVSTVCGP